MMKYSIVFKADEEADSSISHGDSQIASEYLFQHAIGAAVEVFRGHHLISRARAGSAAFMAASPLAKASP
jgi:hypothetical protein